MTLISLFIRLLTDKQLITFSAILYPILKNFTCWQYDCFQKLTRIMHPTATEKNIKKNTRKALISYYQDHLLTLKYLSADKDKINYSFVYKRSKEIKDIVGKKPIIIVAAHLGVNILAPIIAAKEFDVQVIVPIRPYRNKMVLESLLVSYSSPLVTYVQLGSAASKILQVLSKKGIAILGLDVPLPLKYKEKVKFFNHDFELSTGPLWLAKKTNAVMYPACSILTQSAKILFKVYPKIDYKNADNPNQLIADNIEQMIRDHPGHWNQANDYWPNISPQLNI